jgi:hypothetical protein
MVLLKYLVLELQRGNIDLEQRAQQNTDALKRLEMLIVEKTQALEVFKSEYQEMVDIAQAKEMEQLDDSRATTAESTEGA